MLRVGLSDGEFGNIFSHCQVDNKFNLSDEGFLIRIVIFMCKKFGFSDYWCLWLVVPRRYGSEFEYYSICCQVDKFGFNEEGFLIRFLIYVFKQVFIE